MYMWKFVLEIVGSISDLQGHTGKKYKILECGASTNKTYAEQVASKYHGLHH